MKKQNQFFEQFSLNNLLNNIKLSFQDMITVVLGLSLVTFLLPVTREAVLSVLTINLVFGIVFFFTVILIIQALITLIWMQYSWNSTEQIESSRSPSEFLKPSYSFTAIVPVRFEERVIKDTVKAIAKISYPENLKEIIVVLRYDDKDTPVKVQEAINEIGLENNRLIVLLGSYPINKPNKLNYALKAATGDIVCIFDAEDEPHPDIYNIVNTVLLRDKVDVVQSGVQLMNFRYKWFSLLNVMEYFFWFKSGLHFFTHIGHISPLGGNTVFFKRDYLQKVGGWDDGCLTEDADIGFRLTLAGAKTKVIYDELHVTREETPASVDAFIRQRTRWVQGFLQILTKGDWKKLPEFRQKITALYILTAPVIPALLIVYMPVGIVIGLVGQLPVVLSMFTYIPMYLLVLIIIVQIVGLFEFTRAYGYKFTLDLPFRVIITFMPYVFLMAYSSLRAMYRVWANQGSWEKTAHFNLHRTAS